MEVLGKVKKPSRLYTEKYIRDHADTIDWTDVTRYTNFLKYSDELINDFIDDWDWAAIAMNFQLTESLMMKYSHKLSWILISHYQSLSEDMIRKFSNKLVWNIVCQTQYMSYEFCLEFIDNIEIYSLLSNTKIAIKHYNKESCLNEETWISFMKKIKESKKDSLRNKEAKRYVYIDIK